jgi:hypothetical protein
MRTRVLVRCRSDNADFWASDWRPTLVFSVLAGFATTAIRFWWDGRDLTTAGQEVLALAVLMSIGSALVIGVFMFFAFLLLAPSRVWGNDQCRIEDLQTRLDQLVERQKPRLRIFVTHTTHRRFRFVDPRVPGQEIITVGVRSLGVDPIHNIEVLIDDYAPLNVSTPKVIINTVEPLEIQRGGLLFGHARRGQPVYSQVLTIRTFTDVALPEVRVCYMNGAINERYQPFPPGEWVLRVVAAGEESPPEYAFFLLIVEDNAEDRVRLTKLSPDEILSIASESGAVAAVLTEPPADDADQVA